MDAIFESYQESIIIEGFKSSTLSNLFRAAKDKKRQKRYYEDGEPDADGMINDKEFIKKLKQDLGSFMSNIDASNVPEEALETLPVDTFRKKKNKAYYRSAIFVKDGLPKFYAYFHDDGTISYVKEIGAFTRRGDREPKLKDALEYSDSVIAIGNIEKYFKIGSDKSRARWAEKDGAAALTDNYNVLKGNIARYKKILAQNKLKFGDVSGAVDKMIEIFQEFLGHIAKSPMTIKDYSHYDSSQSSKMIKGIEGTLKRASGVINSVEKGYYGGSKSDVESLLKDMRIYGALTKQFIETGELSTAQKNALYNIGKKGK